MKKILALILIMVTVFILPLPAHAHNTMHESIIVPYWTWTDVIKNALDISDSGRADITAYIITSKADKLKIETNLQQKDGSSWTTLKTWTKTDDNSTTLVSGSYYVKRGYYYRLKTAFYVYSDGELKETINDKTVT